MSAQKSVVQSQWHDNIDEDPDTSGISWIRHPKAKFNFYVANNNEYGYFLMKISDKSLQDRILKSGMTLWLNMNNESGKELGIHFPLGSLNSGARNIPGIPDQNSGNAKKDEDLISFANTIELIGFRSEESRRFPSDNADNFRGSVTINGNGTLYYLMRMPAVKIPLRNSKDRKGVMPFTIGIEAGTDKSQLYWIKNIRLSPGK